MRHWFGQSLADWTFTVGSGGVPVLAGGATIAFWSAPVGGVQYTDLLDAAGNPITQVTSSDGGDLPAGTIPRFRGPDGIGYMWADAGGGARWVMTATDLGDALAGKLNTSGGTMTGVLRLDDDSPAASRDYVDARSGGAPSILTWSMTGILSPRTGIEPLYNDSSRALTISAVRASAGIGPAGQALIVDLNKNGTSVFTTQANRPTIASGGLTGVGGTPDITTWGVGEYLTIDIDQVGTTTPGSGLTVTVVAS